MRSAASTSRADKAGSSLAVQMAGTSNDPMTFAVSTGSPIASAAPTASAR